MLLELRVENYAIIDHAVVEFAPGLNLLTGETGAGKSILIDVLSLLLGGRASGDVIRHGAEKAALTALFTAENAEVAGLLQSAGIESDSELILRREIFSNGKGRVLVNNQPATVALLKQIAPYLGTIHAQNESLVSFDAAEKRALLDRFAQIEVEPVAQAFQRQKQIRERIAELERGEQDKLRLLDLWSFQKKEIEDARLEAADEDAKLEAEKRVLANAEKLQASAMSAYELLYDGEQSAAAALATASKHIEEVARYDESFQEAVSTLASARIAVEDVSSNLQRYAEKIDASPQRLAQIEDRLALLDRLKRKYGATLAEVMAFGAEVSGKIRDVENRDEVLGELRGQLATASNEFLRVARQLSQQRQTAAKRMEKIVEGEVSELAMKASFKVRVAASEAVEHWSATGLDTVEFLIATNAGEPLRPLEQIASGGELSRVMLALKVVTESNEAKTNGRSAKTKTPTPPRMLIFDEIDTGIGGRAAEAVGRKLKTLAGSHQVLCITHLAQIASFADHHLLIEKRQHAGRTKTTIRRLDQQERKQELARMMSGSKVTESSIEHAGQMLKANA